MRNTADPDSSIKRVPLVEISEEDSANGVKLCWKIRGREQILKGVRVVD